MSRRALVPLVAALWLVGTTAAVRAQSSDAKLAANLKNTPILAVYGDYIEEDARWPTIRANQLKFGERVKAAGGIRTLAVRTRQQAASALAIANMLEQHPAVNAVHYPGLESHPQHALARRQMQQFGTVLAFDVKGGTETVNALFEKVQLLRVATSLGGPETLVCHPATTTHASLTPEEAVEQGVTPGLVRMSVGLEDTADLIADLSAAL